ncbi:hypothetical protein ANN_23696 [Periplaneta americana]|uniref:Tc1-like transposase DDE domain-containing protein n=1 Tax=Periplaneta americana TaxID=6978 RepID=A0ABQ8SMW4_PERAM|nr:hypothetical protein ANN_23696 [Periplaneta americana]
MESSRIVMWRYKYLNTLRSKRSAGHKIIFLDETWYDTHDVPKKGWDDGSCSCAFSAPVPRGKRIMVLHAGSSDGWVPNYLFLSARNIGDSKADSHDEINSEIFEDWFTNKLMKNLPTSPSCIIVTDNAAYHSRLQFRLPNISTRKDDIVSFMVQHNLEVPIPLPTISVLLELIKEANISREFLIDKIARDFGHEVLRLPPYHFFSTFAKMSVDGYGVSCFNNSVSVEGEDTDDEENGTSEKANPKDWFRNANLTFYTEMFNQQQDLAVADLSEDEDEHTDVVVFELRDEEEPNIFLHALQSELVSVVVWIQRVPGYVPGESPSTQFVCESTKRQECVLEDHDEQVADQPYPRHVRWAKCLANVQARKAVIPVVLRRRLANPRHMSPDNVLLKYGMWSCLREGQYLGL